MQIRASGFVFCVDFEEEHRQVHWKSRKKSKGKGEDSASAMHSTELCFMCFFVIFPSVLQVSLCHLNHFMALGDELMLPLLRASSSAFHMSHIHLIHSNGAY